MSNSFNRLLALTKVDFMASFGIGKSKKEKKQTKGFKTIILLVVIVGLIISTLYNFIFGMSFSLYEKELNLGYPIMVYSLMMFTGITGLLTLSTSIVKVKSIFTGADYEMLAAMPVTKREIITSKILSLYMVELLYSAVILVPNMIICAILSKNALFILTGLVSVFLAPAIPMVLSCLIAMFIALVADRYKFGNVISMIFYLFFFAAIFAFSFFMNSPNASEDPLAGFYTYSKMAEIFAWMNPTTWLLALAYMKNFSYFLIYIPANILIVFGVIAFIALFFEKIHTILTTQHGKEEYVEKHLEVVPQGKTLFKHEAKRFFTSRFYFINSISSGIVGVMMAGFMGWMFSKWSTMIPQDALELLREPLKYHGYVGFLVIAFGIGIATPASVSISIEGKNFWMVKAYPIDYKEYLKAKFWLSTLVLGVCGTLASVILCVFLDTAWYNWIYVTLLSWGYVALASIFSLRINLRKYKFDWKNEQECCKNSTAAVLTMLLDWAVMSVLGSFLATSIIIGVVTGFNAIAFILPPLTIILLYLMTLIFYKHTIKTANKRIEMIHI